MSFVLELNYLIQTLNMKVDLGGHHSLNLYQKFLKLKQTTILVMLEQNIIAKIVEGIMAIFLMMVLILQGKDIVTTEFA